MLLFLKWQKLANEVPCMILFKKYIYQSLKAIRLFLKSLTDGHMHRRWDRVTEKPLSNKVSWAT